MTGRRRIRALYAPEATEDEVRALEWELDQLTPPFGHEREARSLVISIPAEQPVERAMQLVTEALDAIDGRGFVRPARLERWRGHDRTWVDIGPGRLPHVPPPAPAPDSIRWRVHASPVDAMHWEELRSAVESLGRPILGEDQHELTIGAADELDANTVIEELERSGCVRSTSSERLGFFGRWWVRQQLLGNYGAGGG